MTSQRFAAVLLIVVLVSAGWYVLGRTVTERTDDLDATSSAEMASLWGPEALVQVAPQWTADGKKPPVAPDASDIQVKIDLAHRNKGLLWFNTFSAIFDATYTFAPVANAPQSEGRFLLPLPEGACGYDQLLVEVDGQPTALPMDQITSGRVEIPLNLSAARTVRVRYACGGQNYWLYSPGGKIVVPHNDETWSEEQPVFGGTDQPALLKNFRLSVATNFDAIDYPRGTASPSAPAQTGNGVMVANWTYDNAVRSQAMGLTMPTPINAGPVVSRMSFFAPVSLIFFFTVLFTVVVLKKIPLHPMHYLFLAAGFFSFHILLAYLADQISIHLAFWICAAVSVLLVVSYLRLVAGVRFAVVYAGFAQLVYLVGFSYAFFWVGKTGLTVTIGAIATLFVLMQATGKVNWADLFAGPTWSKVPPLPKPAAVGVEDPK